MVCINMGCAAILTIDVLMVIDMHSITHLGSSEPPLLESIPAMRPPPHRRIRSPLGGHFVPQRCVAWRV